MKTWRLLALPGHALSKTASLILLIVGVAVWSISVTVTGVIGADAQTSTAAVLNTAHAWAVMNALAWVALSNTVLLARDARHWRLPRLERRAIASLGLYVLLGVLLPAALLCWMHGDALSVLLLLLIGAGLGMAYALLPAYLSVFVFFAPSIRAGLSTWLPLPAAGQSGFVTWAGPFAILLCALLAWRWRGLQRGDHALDRPNGPTLLLFRQAIWRWSGRGSGSVGDCRAPGRGPRWTQPTVDLCDCGPGHPTTNLRVALGGWWMPQTRSSRARQLVLLLAGVLVGGMFLMLQSLGDAHDHVADIWSDLGDVGSVLFLGTLLSVIIALYTVRTLYQRWSRTDAELPLLALLPGLAGAGSAKPALLRASLLPSLCGQLALALLMLLIAIKADWIDEALVLLMLGPIGSAGLMCSFTLMLFGAGPLRGRGLVWVGGAAYLWICAAAGGALFQQHPLSFGPVALSLLALGWSALFVALLWLGRRGWAMLQQRPHPFLVNR